MNTRRSLAVSALVILMTLIFSGCEQVKKLETGATPGDIQIDGVNYTYNNATLNNNSTVTFEVSVKNLGGLDSAGAYVSAYVDNKLIGQKETGVMGSAVTPESAEKVLALTWKATAGAHTAAFLIKTDSNSVADAEHIIELDIAAAELAVKETKTVTDTAEAKVVVQEKVTAVVATVAEDKSLTEVIADTASITAALEDETVEENEKAVLQTLKVVADEELTVAEDVVPTVVTLEDEEEIEDTTTSTPKAAVEVVFLPLAKKKVAVDTTTGDTLTDSTSGEILTETEVDSGAFLVAISTEVEEVTAQEVTDTGVVKTTAKKKVTVPMAVKVEKDTVTNAKKTTIKNGLGGLSISSNGDIDLLAVPTRAIAGDFWALIKPELAVVAKDYALAMAIATTAAEELEALIKVISKITSIITAFELQSAVTNEKPEITVEASKAKSETQSGNDLIRVSYDVFTATATDDKAGVTFVNSGSAVEVFNPGYAGSLEPVAHTFTAVDSDDESVSVKVTAKYTRQVIVNYYVHDQGAAN